jgi:hypothetical protein
MKNEKRERTCRGWGRGTPFLSTVENPPAVPPALIKNPWQPGGGANPQHPTLESQTKTPYPSNPWGNEQKKTKEKGENGRDGGE